MVRTLPHDRPDNRAAGSGKLNVDQNMQTANKYRISAIPTLMIFKEGKLIDKLVGAYPKPALAAKLQKYL